MFVVDSIHENFNTGELVVGSIDGNSLHENFNTGELL